LFCLFGVFMFYEKTEKHHENGNNKGYV